MKNNGTEPTLCVVSLGQKPEDLSYERGLLKKAEKLGIEVNKKLYDENITQEELASELRKIDADNNNHGILIFRPLPSHIDEK